MKNKILKNWYITSITKNKTRPDCKKCEHEHNNYCDNFEHEVGEKGSEEVFCSEYNPKTTGSNDNNWHWKTIGQGEGIQKVKMSRLIDKMSRYWTSFELKWIAICIGLVVIALIIAGCFTKKDLDNFGNNLPAVVPAIETKEPQYTEMKGIFYAYTPRWQETDNSPLINASGHRVQLGDIANNCLPFGTKIKVGETIYTVRDRMNSRYGCEYFDILFFDLDSAKMWGRRELNYTINK